MKTSGTNRKLRVLLTGIKNGTLLPRPEFQRRLVWANKHKQEFVRTVLMEYPFPEIYIAAGHVDSNTGEGTEMLVDGQQRMTTLYQYFTGSQDLKLGDITPYAKLGENEKLAFLDYEVVVRDLGQKTIEEIKEVFTRINSTKYSLNAMEIRNARYDGAFKQFGEHLMEHVFFEEHPIFTAADVRRMGDLLFCLTVVVTIISTYFNRDDDIEEALKNYNDEFPLAEEIMSRLNHVFGFIAACRLAPDSRAWKKADALTLIVELERALCRDKVPLKPEITGSRLMEFYALVEAVAAGRTKNNDAEKYYKAALQASNDRSSRITRGQVLAAVVRKP
jgi:hypothetical protein